MNARFRLVLAIASALGASSCSRPAAVEPPAPPEPARPSWQVPRVSAAGLEPLRAAHAIEVTRATVALDGEPVVELGDAAAGASEVHIAALSDALAATRDERGAGADLALAVAPDVSYRTFFQVVASAQKAGLRSFEVAVASGDGMAAIPLSLPDSGPAASDQPGAIAAPATMIVTVGKSGQTLLWSLSGQEGTLEEPLFEAPSPELAGLQEALAGVRARRPGSSSIILMMDPTQSFASCAAIMASVRTAPSGEPLFADLMLAQPSLDLR